ncbi:hypothetical protein F5141DRAFT_1067894 [Pisolithus sp. B1]|nr:hypothetical protein F5141DRAFT_1067894 [Pisolithus sp. B1]
MNLKNSLYTLLVAATGLGGPTQTEFSLCNSEEKSYATILVMDIRLDLSSHTVVADSWIILWTNNIQYKVKIEQILPIKTGAHESEAWRHLFPLFIERCHTWKHKPSYPKKVPWCSCGMGIGTEVLRERYGNVSAKYAMRAAISPLFPVSYMEKVGVNIDDPIEPAPTNGIMQVNLAIWYNTASPIASKGWPGGLVVRHPSASGKTQVRSLVWPVFSVQKVMSPDGAGNWSLLEAHNKPLILGWSVGGTAVESCNEPITQGWRG